MKDYGLIEYQYLFSTYNEFREKCVIIKNAYAKWNKTEIALYRMYVYSRPFISEAKKELIWEELNLYRNLCMEEENEIQI